MNKPTLSNGRMLNIHKKVLFFIIFRISLSQRWCDYNPIINVDIHVP